MAKKQTELPVELLPKKKIAVMLDDGNEIAIYNHGKSIELYSLGKKRLVLVFAEASNHVRVVVK